MDVGFVLSIALLLLADTENKLKSGDFEPNPLSVDLGIAQ